MSCEHNACITGRSIAVRCCCHHGVGLYFSGAIRSRLIARQYALQILCRSWRSHPVSPLSGRNPRVTASRSYRGSGLNRRAPRYSSFLPAQPTCNRHFADATLRAGWRRCFQRNFIWSDACCDRDSTRQSAHRSSSQDKHQQPSQLSPECPGIPIELSIVFAAHRGGGSAIPQAPQKCPRQATCCCSRTPKDNLVITQ